MHTNHKKLFRSAAAVICFLMAFGMLFGIAAAQNHTVNFYIAFEDGRFIADPWKTDTTDADDHVADPGYPTGDEYAGYSFDGWYLQVEFTNKWAFTNQAGGDISLYALATPKDFDVTYELNGGSWDGETKFTASAPFGSTISKPTPDPVKEGYTFGGWLKPTAAKAAHTEPVTDPSGGDDTETQSNYWDFENDTMPAYDLTLTADWAGIEHTLTYVMNDYGTALDPVTYHTGDALVKPTDPSDNRAKFVGWYADQALTQAFDWEQTMPGADVTVYAKWELPFTVTYDLNGGHHEPNDMIEPQNVFAGDPIIPVTDGDVTRDGFELIGWKPSVPEGTTLPDGYTLPDLWPFDDPAKNVMPPFNMILTAQWREVQDDDHDIFEFFCFDDDCGRRPMPLPSTGFPTGE